MSGNNDEPGGYQSQEGQAHAYLDFLAAQEKQGWQDPLVSNDDGGGAAGTDTDATHTDTDTGPDDVVANDNTGGGPPKPVKERSQRGHDAQMSSAPEDWW